MQVLVFFSAFVALCSAFGVVRRANNQMDLYQSDFDHGSVIVSVPGTIVRLMEDIKFDGSNVQSPFPLGWFAALVIAADDVHVDLQGYELSMSEEYYLRQRFFALIEIGDKPFIEGQGPAAWGPFVPSRGVEIYNGKLGLTSHHAIHGSDVVKAKIFNLQMYEFEVAGIHFNGAYKVDIENCDIGPSKTTVPVLATLSNAINLIPQLQEASAIDDFTTPLGSMANLASSLENAVETEIQDVLEGKLAGARNPLFANPSGLPDGSAVYGIVIHRIGVAIGPLGAGEDLADRSSVNIDNVRVHDLNLEAISWASVPVATGPFGDKLNFQFVTNDDGSFNGGNILFNSQLALMLYGKSKAYDPDFSGSWATLTTEAADKILTWTESAGADVQQEDWWVETCDGDVMHHGIKGVFGMRLEFADSVSVKYSTVENLSGRFDPLLSSKFCNHEPLKVVGVSTGLHDKVHLQNVDIRNVAGFAGISAFYNVNCHMNQVRVCNSNEGLAVKDTTCEKAMVVYSDACL